MHLDRLDDVREPVQVLVNRSERNSRGVQMLRAFQHGFIFQEQRWGRQWPDNPIGDETQQHMTGAPPASQARHQNRSVEHPTPRSYLYDIPWDVNPDSGCPQGNRVKEVRDKPLEC